jgi:hypothetical protein
MRLAPTRCIDLQREETGGSSVPTARLALPVGVDSPPDYFASENQGYRTPCHCESVSYCSSVHRSLLGKPILRVGLFVFTMVQASICLLAIGAS